MFGCCFLFKSDNIVPLSISYSTEIPVRAEGNLVGYINNIDIPSATFTADMLPLPDGSATRINATLRKVPQPVGEFS